MAGPDDPQDAENAGEVDSPRTKLMEEVAAQMDAIEADFGDDFEILRVLTVVVLQRPDGNVGIRVRNAETSPLEAVGYLSLAQDILKAQAIEQDE